MAERRITEVDEMGALDPNQDSFLIVRGTARDLRRMRAHLLQNDFDLHDDVAQEKTAPSALDRLLISDEGAPGAPNKWIRFSRLVQGATNAFDLHDDVAVELTTLADNDRMLVSDEGDGGDPQKWISLATLREWLESRSGALKFEKLADQINSNSEVLINHNLGRVPLGFSVRLICIRSQLGYNPGDELLLDCTTAFFLSEITTTSFRAWTQYSIGNIRAPAKNSSSSSNLAANNWRFGLTVWG